MAVASDQRIINRAHGRALPDHWTTLYELTKLSDDEFDHAIKDGVIKPDMERSDVPRAAKRSSPSGAVTVIDGTAKPLGGIHVSLEQWDKLDPRGKASLLSLDPDQVGPAHFNKQESDAIEWAQWSWNPITGCEHTCPYCYARDIALGRAKSAYPNGFAPTLKPRSLLAPRNMKVRK